MAYHMRCRPSYGVWRITHAATRPMAYSVRFRQPHDPYCTLHAVLPLAYSIRYCQAYGLLSINLLDSRCLSIGLVRSVLLSNSFKAMLPTAYIMHYYQALSYGVHCC